MNHLQKEYNTEGIENVTPETEKLYYLYVIYREEDPEELPLDSVSLSELAHFMGLSNHATAQRFRRAKDNKVHHGSFIIERVNLHREDFTLTEVPQIWNDEAGRYENHPHKRHHVNTWNKARGNAQRDFIVLSCDLGWIKDNEKQDSDNVWTMYLTDEDGQEMHHFTYIKNESEEENTW